MALTILSSVLTYWPQPCWILLLCSLGQSSSQPRVLYTVTRRLLLTPPVTITRSASSMAQAQLEHSVVVNYIDGMQFTVQYPISYLSGKKMDDFDEFLESISDVLGLARPPIKTTPSGEAQLECSNLGCSSVCDTDQEPW